MNLRNVSDNFVQSIALHVSKHRGKNTSLTFLFPVKEKINTLGSGGRNVKRKQRSFSNADENIWPMFNPVGFFFFLLTL